MTELIESEKLEYEYNIDYWSEGRFEQLKSEFERTFSKLQSLREGKASLDDLDLLRAETEKMMGNYPPVK